MLLEPFLEVFKLSATIVVNGVLLVALGVELEGWVTSDFKTVNFVGSSVELGNGKVGDILEFLSELFPDWGEFLAVTAPWGVVLDEDVVVAVDNGLLEVLSDDDLEWFGGLSWDFLGLKEWLELLVLEVINELADLVNGE